jgi:anaerobic selenocysteine-containing dehydrogenase
MSSSATTVKFTCPLDCFDMCSLEATVVENQVTQVRAELGHPLTRGFCCRKGKALLERLYHPERLKNPLRRTGSSWSPIGWDEAVDEMADRISAAVSRYGSPSILNFSGSGHGGLAKKIDSVFFNRLGGVSVPRGSLCWGAGMAAQQYDFGAVRSPHPEMLAKARTIVLWGRNPVDTNPHLIPLLKTARRGGARLIVIDPRRSPSARLADRHIAVRPATDGALALGMIHVIVEEGLHDADYIQDHVHGFEAFRPVLAQWTPRRTAETTGVDADLVRELAQQIATAKPAAVVIGYGLQRYGNGGGNVRCIDAVAAVTGNIGLPGGGIYYADKSTAAYIGGDIADSRQLAVNQRTFSVTRTAEFLTNADPPVQVAFVIKANPLVQLPDIEQATAAFASVDFKVVIDPFMTDTARHADLVLPCTGILEEEDVIFSNMFSPYLQHSGQAVAPPENVMSEFDLFGRLADRMGDAGFPRDRRRFLEQALQPLTAAFGVDLESLRRSAFVPPRRRHPWQDGCFATPSGKYELYSQTAREHGHDPLPVFQPPEAAPGDYPLRLLTLHHRDSMHSQHFAFVETLPIAYVHPQALQQAGRRAGDTARLVSARGVLEVTLAEDAHLPADAVMVHQGWWHHSGSVNVLTETRISDMGEQAAYYDSFCRLEPAA